MQAISGVSAIAFGKKTKPIEPRKLTSWLEKFGWAEVEHTHSDRHPDVIHFTRLHQAKHVIHVPNNHHGDKTHVTFAKEVANVLHAPLEALSEAVNRNLPLRQGWKLIGKSA